MAKTSNAEAPKSDPCTRAIDALLALAAEMPWDVITLTEIAARADLSLADLRDLFPSKGAMLGGFVRRIDRIMLESIPKDMIDEPARERVLDLMLRRFDALLPYRAALRSITKGMAGDPLGLMALNQQGLNSWRYLLESAGIETNGPMGALRVQGAILVFARAFRTFLDDEDAALARTMAVLDRELARGEWVLRRAEGLDRIFAPLRGLCRATRAGRHSAASPQDSVA